MSKQRSWGKSWRAQSFRPGGREDPREAPIGPAGPGDAGDQAGPGHLRGAGNLLNLDLGQGEQASIVSLGGSYRLSLAGGVWSGGDSGDVAGNGTSTLTVTGSGIADFARINITDSGPGAIAVFADMPLGTRIGPTSPSPSTRTRRPWC